MKPKDGTRILGNLKYTFQMMLLRHIKQHGVNMVIRYKGMI